MDDKQTRTMDCTDIKAMLSGLIDDQVNAQVRHRAERHLAQCKDCRELLSEAERIEALVAAKAGGGDTGGQPPTGFEAAVLSRTVHVQRRWSAANRWTSWVGWIAAAASLLLAISVWMLDHQAVHKTSEHQSVGSTPGVITASYVAGPEMKSWTLEDAVPSETLHAASAASGSVTHDPEITQRAVAQEPVQVKTDAAALLRNDAETLDGASVLLAMLVNADDRSFANIEHVRRITEYDQLLSRLAEARRNLPAEDRPVVLAAESVLYRVVRGPLDLQEVRELRDTVVRLDLSRRIDTISSRWSWASSL